MPEVNLDRLRALVREARKNTIVYTGSAQPRQPQQTIVQQKQQTAPATQQNPPRRGGCGCSRR